GRLTKAGAGTLTLSGTNTYSGGTEIAGGILQIAEDANLCGANGALTFNGGTLRTTAGFTSRRDVTLAAEGGIDVASGTALGLHRQPGAGGGIAGRRPSGRGWRCRARRSGRRAVGRAARGTWRAGNLDGRSTRPAGATHLDRPPEGRGRSDARAGERSRFRV